MKLILAALILLATYVNTYAAETNEEHNQSAILVYEDRLPAATETFQQYMADVEREQEFYADQKEFEVLKQVEVRNPIKTSQY